MSDQTAQDRFFNSLGDFGESVRKNQEFDRSTPDNLSITDPRYWEGGILFIDLLVKMFIAARDGDDWLRS